MSFILDALRKSEIERQRQSGPSIAELPVAREDRRLPIALVAIGLLLAVNVGVLLFFMMRDGATPAADATLSANVVTPSAAAALLPAATLPAATEAPVAAANTGPEATFAPATGAPEFATQPPAAPDPTLLPDAPVATPAARVTYSEGPPLPVEPLSSQATGLPELTIDLHVFADDPARRAVFINGRRYLQGATIAEGPVVEEITRDGAVLNYRGRRFMLPRL